MADRGNTAHSINDICLGLANLEEVSRLRKAEIEQIKAEFALKKSECDILMINSARLQARHESQVRAMIEREKRFADAQRELDTLMKKVYVLQKKNSMTTHFNKSVECKNKAQQIMAVTDKLNMEWVKISTEMAEAKLQAHKHDIECMENINSYRRVEKEIHETIQRLTGKLNEFEQRHQQITDASDAGAGTGPCSLCGGQM